MVTYAFGYFLAFLLYRIVQQQEFNHCDKDDIIYGLVLSFLSWVAVVWMLMRIINNLIDKEKDL